VGDRVEKGQPLVTIHANEPRRLEQAREQVGPAFGWSETPVPPLPLFYS
jgi:pyrimidine-nucleoside phosphorylase